MRELKVSKSRQRISLIIDETLFSFCFCVDPPCCGGASDGSIFLAGIALIRLISADIVVHVVHLVWPAAMVISGSYACLWSSAGRAEPHTSQHLVASRPRIPYTYLFFPAVCRVLPNSFSFCCTPDVHHGKQDGGGGWFWIYVLYVFVNIAWSYRYYATRVNQIQLYGSQDPCALFELFRLTWKSLFPAKNNVTSMQTLCNSVYGWKNEPQKQRV